MLDRVEVCVHAGSNTIPPRHEVRAGGNASASSAVGHSGEAHEGDCSPTQHRLTASPVGAKARWASVIRARPSASLQGIVLTIAALVASPSLAQVQPISSDIFIGAWYWICGASSNSYFNIGKSRESAVTMKLPQLREYEETCMADGPTTYKSDYEFGYCEELWSGPGLYVADAAGGVWLETGWRCYIKQTARVTGAVGYSEHRTFNPARCPAGTKFDSGTRACVAGVVPKKNTGGCDAAAGVSLVAHPVNPATGNKFLQEVDIPRVGRGHLQFVRYFNGAAMDQLNPAFRNQGWRHNFQSSILELAQGQVVYVDRADGRAYSFTRSGSTWVGEPDVSDTLVSLVKPDGSAAGWMLRRSGGWFEQYDELGALRRRTLRDGYAEALDYGTSTGAAAGARLRSVTDSDGRSLTLSYLYGLLRRVEHSSGFAVDYSSETHAETTTYPGLSTKRYEYYWPVPHLHNVIDENGVAYSSYAYDDAGRAVRSELAGGAESFAFSYGPNNTATTVVDPLGTSRTTTYTNINGALKPTSSSQPAGAGCLAASSSSQYDARGNLIRSDDFNQKRTCFAYALTRNVRTQEIEGLPSTASCDATVQIGATLPINSRKRTTDWHPDWDLAIRIAQPKRLTTHVYNGMPDPTNGNALASCAPASALLPDGKPIAVLCKTVEQATTDPDGSQGLAAANDPSVPARTTSYTYDAFGRPLTVTDARGKQTVLTYYQDTTADHWVGDLQSIRNPLGQVTAFLRYDRAGRLLESTAPNGVKTTITYTPRGWVESVTTASSNGGLSELTAYQYDRVGQVKVVTLPDGAVLQYTYDDAHRLSGVVDPAGNTVTYTFDAAGNRVSEQTKDSSGTLARNVQRAFDALNRLQTLTGSLQ